MLWLPSAGDARGVTFGAVRKSGDIGEEEPGPIVGCSWRPRSGTVVLSRGIHSRGRVATWGEHVTW